MNKEKENLMANAEPPAMGERRARLGYGYQDKVATERTLNALRDDLRAGTAGFEGVRLADLNAGRVDDFVMVWRDRVEGNSIKWSADGAPITWGFLIGAEGLIKELAEGYLRLRAEWVGRSVKVRLHVSRIASSEKHHAQLITSVSVAEFVSKHWALGPTAAQSPELAKVWQQIAMHAGLASTEFSTFVTSCELSLGQPEPPGIGTGTMDSRHYRKQFDALHKAISTWVTNSPESVLIDRDYLLAAIGVHVGRSGLIQRFPEPSIPYEKNHSAAQRLRDLIEVTAGAYLAVVGNAGVGKSTLVQDVLTSATCPYFVPYYAFLPNTEGNRDRAEALTFFQDVVERLDRFDPARRGLGIVDVSQGRSALRRHMASANMRYVLTGEKTVLLIDGLDHVMREVGLQTSVLNELPHPTEIPDGFIIILSGQPQAMLPDAIPAAAAASIKSDARRVEVAGLSRAEVHTLIVNFARPTSGEERDDLYAACLGNPLILTYILGLLDGAEPISVGEAIELAGKYEGKIDPYYRERLAAPLLNSETRQALGLLCRAAPTLDVEWLAEWPEKRTIEDIYRRLLQPFLRRHDDGRLQFIHDSLISFLRVETRSPLSTYDQSAEERKFYSILADRAQGRRCIDPVGRARVVYLMKSERYSDVCENLSSGWMREGIRSFLPYAHLEPLILAGYAAACATNDWGHLVRLVLVGYELNLRATRFDGEKLARILLRLGKDDLALAQVQWGGRLLISDSSALGFSRDLVAYADRHERADLREAARKIYLQAKPILTTSGAKALDMSGLDDEQKTTLAWLDVAPLFEDAASITNEVQAITFASRLEHDRADPELLRASLLLRAMDAAVAAGREFQECQIFAQEIEARAPAEWHFHARLRLGEAFPSRAQPTAIHEVPSKDKISSDSQLAYAWLLARQGHKKQAADVLRHLVHIRFELTDNKHSWGYTDITYSVRLRWLQILLDVPEGTVPGVTEEMEARARVEYTARRLGELRAKAMQGEVSRDLDSLFRSLLFFHNIPIQFATVSQRDSYMLPPSRREIYRQISAFAKEAGIGAIAALRDVLLGLMNSSAASEFLPYQLRFFSKFLFEEGVLPRNQAIQLGLSSTNDAIDDDPLERQEACLEIAMFLHELGDTEGAEAWLSRASESSVGAGSHKDYHMAHIAEWLARSIGHIGTDELATLERFARAVEVAGGSGGRDGAAKELQLLVRRSPSRARRLGLEWIERGVLRLSSVIDSLIIGGAEARADSDLLRAIYCELHTLIEPGDTSEAALAVLSAHEVDKKRGVAVRMMSHVRKNAMPSHRVDVARALQDAIRDEGLEPLALTGGLRRSRDDSSRKGALYTDATGEVRTLSEIAARLSNPSASESWNPNPDENADFDWWGAIKAARLEGPAHLDALISRFPPPDYREVELLVSKADVALKSASFTAARHLVEQAILRSKDATWSRWHDGAQKITAFLALQRIDRDEGIRRGRAQFSEDLSAGRLPVFSMLGDIPRILDALAVDWPATGALKAVNEYLEEVLNANAPVPIYEAFTEAAPSWSASQAIAASITDLLGCPIVDIGVAARRVIAEYVSTGGSGVLSLLNDVPAWRPVQLEHLLAALHVGVSRSSMNYDRLRSWVEGLNRSDSVAVRSIAKQICLDQGWDWKEITNAPQQPVILLSRDQEEPQGDRMLIGADVTNVWKLHQRLFVKLERLGLESNELRSEFEHIYYDIEKSFYWAEKGRLERWVRRSLVRHWLKPRAIQGREAAMRVLGRRALSGQVPSGAEDSYDYLYPIYDRLLELHPPMERPTEFEALEWDVMRKGQDEWLQGHNADKWSNYPDAIDGKVLIGERTLFIRPEWEWPREERFRGLTNGEAINQDELDSNFDLTYEMYAAGHGQGDHQLVISNAERQLIGSAYRWVGINANLAHALGWRLCDDVPFQWVDRAGKVMIQSKYWKNGWIWIEPPRFEALGEGWMVLAAPEAIDDIRRIAPGAELHLWVERRSHGDRPYQGRWHLNRQLGCDKNA